MADTTPPREGLLRTMMGTITILGTIMDMMSTTMVLVEGVDTKPTRTIRHLIHLPVSDNVLLLIQILQECTIIILHNHTRE